MIVLGITGSIGMGKTTAANMLRDMGIPVHDSDQAARGLTGPGGRAVAAVAAAFPESWDRAKGSINRAILRGLVRNNPQKLDLLESILHPLVVEAQQDWLREQKSNGVKIAGLDIPLLFETGAENRVDYTIVVTAPEFLQRQRVMGREGMTEEDFAFLLSRQMPDAEKRARADFVVQTGNGLAYTRQELQQIITKIRGNAPSHESRHLPS
jgi:dephospho-CoA kinase